MIHRKLFVIETMTKEEAKQALKYHSLTEEIVTSSKIEQGFLGMLRPFQGDLREENFHEVMKIIRVLADEIRNRDVVDKDLISAIWSICHLTRSWGIEENGPLRRNNLLSNYQVEKLTKWIDCISYAMMMLLDGQDDEEVFEFYERKRLR